MSFGLPSNKGFGKEDNCNRIPRSFVNKCWEGISNPVLLLLPNGVEWKVKWKKLDADILLIEDWKEFAEFCSLDKDHLLVFEYLRKSQFLVVIFDQNGLEMEYPLMGGTLDGDEKGNSLCQHKRAKSPVPFSSSIKKVKGKTLTSYPSHDVRTERAQSQRTKVEFSKEFLAEDLERGGRGRGMMNAKRRCSNSNALKSSTALERAKAFRSENPFFIREMHPSYIHKYIMVMPGNFLTEDQQKENDSVTLWISEERSWHVKFYTNRSGGQINLSTGWVDFVKDNNLKIGNVCVFEQIKKTRISFRVFIFRDGEESSPSNFSDSEFRGCNNEVSENHFTLSIKPCQFYCMNVPKKFIRNHEMDGINEVTLQVGKRSWNVKLDCYGRFTSGLHDFMSQHNVEAGDVIHFELIDKKKFVFQVRVTRCISIDFELL
ncbi:B3 domain-containing transcription factor VRN1 [Glycine soja]|uniref:B3 domain-containing transcription factor VRN1 n=1 Tax=Glycine soja TaxID=3848 RepID=A0A445F3A1_GLYSO|nr:B3 domain-containing transcription factor VRN1 [Glycine soja]